MRQATLARLIRQLKRHRITQGMVAAAVKPRPVDRTQVNHVFAGRHESTRVIAAARMLLAQRGRRNGQRVA